MHLRPYQIEAVNFLLMRRRALIHAPAGSGKTVIGAAALAEDMVPGSRALWLCNTIEQLAQAGKAIEAFPGPGEAEVCVSCVASQPSPAGFDFVIFDEAHHVPAETWNAITRGLSPETVVWGLTATPWHDDEERNEAVRRLFSEIFTIDRAALLADGHLVEGRAFLHDIDHPGMYDPEIDEEVAKEVRRRCAAFRGIPAFEHERRARWQITQKFLQESPSRNAAIVTLAQTARVEGNSTLILVHSIEHGELLRSQIGGDATMVHSKIAKKKRLEIITRFRSGELKTLVATSLADEGLDVPVASVLILAAGGRSAGKLEQRAGRVLRPHAGKVGGTIHDFLDRGALFAHAQAKARKRVYEMLGYSPEIVKHGIFNYQKL